MRAKSSIDITYHIKLKVWNTLVRTSLIRPRNGNFHKLETRVEPRVSDIESLCCCGHKLNKALPADQRRHPKG